jgi:hypothetical protein
VRITCLKAVGPVLHKRRAPSVLSNRQCSNLNPSNRYIAC